MADVGDADDENGAAYDAGDDNGPQRPREATARDSEAKECDADTAFDEDCTGCVEELGDEEKLNGSFCEPTLAGSRSQGHSMCHCAYLGSCLDISDAQILGQLAGAVKAASYYQTAGHREESLGSERETGKKRFTNNLGEGKVR